MPYDAVVDQCSINPGIQRKQATSANSSAITCATACGTGSVSTCDTICATNCATTCDSNCGILQVATDAAPQ